MNLDQMIGHYPHLYHMAWGGSWPSIEKYGLHSTASLLRLFDVSEIEANRILEEHRPRCVEIVGNKIGTAVIRDQKPMSDRGVIRALGDSASLHEWYRLLNSMVFFWPTKDRLKTMLSAKAYRDIEHDILVVRTAPIVEKYVHSLRISPINSGCTKPFPHPRTPEIFHPIDAYPFDDRLKRFGSAKAIAEVCFRDAVTDISDYVEKVISTTGDDFDKHFC